MKFVRRYNANRASHSKSLGTHRLSHSRAERDSMSSDLDNISGGVGYSGTSKTSLPDGEAETVRLVPE